ncbi:MAG: ABC transporter permease [Paracoccaceae bacterium]
MLLRTALIIAAFGLFASLVGWILQQAPGDAPTFLARATSLLFWALVALVALWLLATLVFAADGNRGIVVLAFARFLPVWIALAVTFALSIRYKKRLGLFGKLMDSPVGLMGLAIVLFWVFTAIFADLQVATPAIPALGLRSYELFHIQIITFNPLSQLSGMKNIAPGSALQNPTEGAYPYYLLGGDHLARDVFSRVVMGARRVLQIAPAATVFAFMVGITLGLPAGYFGGKLDTFLSFLANLVLAFPVILLFYLLVTPEIVETGIPMWFAAVLFVFPIIFLVVLFNSRYKTNPPRRNLYVGITLVLGLWAYSGLAFNLDPTGLFSMAPNLLNVFVSVVFVNSPGVFRIVRGLVMDLKARDYVSAAQTRGETPWYIMLWEILPNARGPLIVDFCLRIGYTTILLGTLGFFGLGVSPESPDWGSTIDDGRRLLSIYLHPAVVPALALMSLVLGLNLLADGLREESLRD